MRQLWKRPYVHESSYLTILSRHMEELVEPGRRQLYAGFIERAMEHTLSEICVRGEVFEGVEFPEIEVYAVGVGW